jgi:hypothetical protein
MNCRRLLTWVVVVAAALGAGCGSDGPSSPSAGGTGVEVQGLLLGEGASFVASSGANLPAAKAQKVVVTVEGTTITAEVSANGTFVLKGIPSGTFTLIFTIDGKTVGQITVTAEDGAEVKIVVKFENGALVLVELEIESPEPAASPSPTSCVISGGRVNQGIELEGVVAPGGNSEKFDMTVNGERGRGVVHVTADGASYRCIGGAKVDSDSACKALIALGGAKVHVRGLLTGCDGASASVTATEVKIQKD